jgi:hypothetical protein
MRTVRSTRRLCATRWSSPTGDLGRGLDRCGAEPIDGGQRPDDVRAAAAREGRNSKGPAGYLEGVRR